MWIGILEPGEANALDPTAGLTAPVCRGNTFEFERECHIVDQRAPRQQIVLLRDEANRAVRPDDLPPILADTAV